LLSVPLILDNRRMAKINLSSPTMVTVTSAWLDPKKERPLIESLPQAGGLLSSLEKAHKGMLTSQVSVTAVETELTTLQKAEAVLDVRHDRKVRGKYNVLTGFADLADDEKTAASYLALRDSLTPHGLEVVRWSYTDQAGEAELVDSRLTKEEKALLGKLPTPDGSLLDAHKARVKAGKDLGDLEKKRAALETQASTATTPADVIRARNLWIRAVNAFVAVLALEEDLSDEDREKILGPLARAEQKADRKRSSGAEADLVVVAPVEAKAAEPKAVEAKPAEAKPADPAADPAKVK
jgi:hypothetical protein